MQISKPHTDPRGRRHRAGGMTLVNCHPACEAEFRSASVDAVIHDQLKLAGWQVIEETKDSKKIYTYRCPVHRVVEHSRMAGVPLAPRGLASGKEKKASGRSSHDGGDS